MPEKGNNAALILFKNLAKISNNAKFRDFFDKIGPTDASGLKADGYSETMGNNTLNLGFVNYENNNHMKARKIYVYTREKVIPPG